MTKSFSTTVCWSAVLLGMLPVAPIARATQDYGPAVDRMITGCTKYYTSGVGKQFLVVHDMEGYYLSTISYLSRCDKNASGDFNVSVSCHYAVSGLKDSSGDAEAGEISQLVREANYSWHAVCWNTHSIGVEHEGFVSNPAWYTEDMYQASAALFRHFCDKYNIPKDRNHVVGHYQWQDTTWVNWVIANLGFDPRCNSHTDPGPYWDWTHYMSLINVELPTMYDQTLTNIFANGTNRIDLNATTAPNTAVVFSNAVKTAFAAGHGGVFDFPTTIAGGTTLYRGAYAGGTRRLNITSSVAMQNANSSGGTYYPISNPNFTTTQPASADFTLKLGPVYDATGDSLIPGESVATVGFVVLSRTEVNYPLDVRATATFSDDSTQAVTSVIGNPRGSGDVFFGFTAPASLAIKQVRLQSFVTGTQTPVTNKIAFDDFGFTTIEEAWLTDPADGWADAWQWTSGEPELRAQNPLDGTSPYLRLDSTNGSIRNFMRQYESGAVDITKRHFIRWKFRLSEDSFNTNFGTFNDRVHFFAYPVSRLGGSTASANSWSILAAGAASSGAVGGKTFWIFDNVDGSGTFSVTNQVDSQVPLIPNHQYAFEVLVMPETKSYRVTILDSASGATFSSSAPHKFRDLSDASHTFLHFGTQASSTAIRRPFDLDSVTVSQAAWPVRLTNPTWNGPVFSFSFQSQSNALHAAQFLSAANGNTWSNVLIITGDGTVKTVAHTNPPAGPLLYRISSTLP